MYPILGEDGAVREVVLMLQDATERRREEELQALREGAERVCAIIDAAHDAFAGVDADGTIRHWNGQAEAITGVLRDRLDDLLEQLSTGVADAEAQRDDVDTSEPAAVKQAETTLTALVATRDAALLARGRL